MANIAVDRGWINGDIPETVYKPLTKHTQVWYATHDGEGKSLPHRYRSFISFSYGDKWIEDFNLIAYCDGDTMSRPGYASFEDLTTNYDIMDGQYYHGTHYKPNTLSLSLVSDGIDQKQLDEFLHWFQGGKTRELVLAEHPNRAIMARVASAPELDVLPCEEPIEIIVNGIKYTTSTTLYKGTISLELVSDSPFWYAKQNVLIYNTTTNKGIFSGIKLTNTVPLFKEAIKVVYEDMVPFNSMAQTTMHFGENQYASVGTSNIYSLIVGPYNANDPTTKPDNWDTLALSTNYYTTTVNGQTEYWCGARIDGTKNNKTYVGRIAGAVMVNEDTTMTGPIPKGATTYQLFYGGTAPSPTILSFKVNLAPLNNAIYINGISNEYAVSNNKPYSTITLTSVHTKTFDFTTPNIITSWNKTRKLFENISTSSSGTNWSDLADTLRDQIRHPAVRTFAIAIVNHLQSNNTNNTYLTTSGVFTSNGKTTAINLLKRFFVQVDGGEWSTAEFTFDAENGTALGTFSYWKSKVSNENVVSNMLSNNSNAEFVTTTESVGDMLRSNWLIIEDHNILVNNQYIGAWNKNSPMNAHKLTHDAPAPLIDLKLQYKNRYL